MENVEIIIEIPYKEDENLFQQIMNSIINLKDKSSDYVVVLNSKTVEDNNYNVIDGMRVIYAELDDNILLQVVRGEVKDEYV